MLRQPLEQPYVPGLGRCRLEFFSADTASLKERYVGKRRHRFNKYDFLTDVAPLPTQEGLVFSCNSAQKMAGLVTSFRIPGSGANFSYNCVLKNCALTGSCTEAYVTMFIMKYDAPYWTDLSGVASFMRREVQSGEVYYGSPLNTFGLSPVSHFRLNVASMFGFSVSIQGTSSIITYLEYDSQGNLLGSQSWNKALDGLWDKYRVGFAIEVSPSNLPSWRGSASCTLVKQDITSAGGVVIPSRELIFFEQNPDAYELPIPTPRNESNNLYPLPHTAFIEDAKTKVSATTCSLEWYRKLKYLVDTTIEPFKFTDIEGREFLCCFDKLKGSPRRFKGNKKYGYELEMQLLMMH